MEQLSLGEIGKPDTVERSVEPEKENFFRPKVSKKSFVSVILRFKPAKLVLTQEDNKERPSCWQPLSRSEKTFYTFNTSP